MKSGYGLLLAALLVVPGLAGCTTPAVTASLGEPFTLGPGQSASIPGEDLTVRFAEVVSDSRCPAGVTCIWAGEVELPAGDNLLGGDQ